MLVNPVMIYASKIGIFRVPSKGVNLIIPLRSSYLTAVSDVPGFFEHVKLRRRRGNVGGRSAYLALLLTIFLRPAEKTRLVEKSVTGYFRMAFPTVAHMSPMSSMSKMGEPTPISRDSGRP